MIPNEGDTIVLIPKTRKGKNRLQNNTNCWLVHKIQESVQRLRHTKGAFLIEINEDGSPTERFPHVKWIALPTDQDFKWETK
jgi:hypothetical protein